MDRPKITSDAFNALALAILSDAVEVKLLLEQEFVHHGKSKQTLIKLRALLSMVNHENDSLLAIACKHGKLQLVVLLLETSLQLNVKVDPKKLFAILLPYTRDVADTQPKAQAILSAVFKLVLPEYKLTEVVEKYTDLLNHALNSDNHVLSDILFNCFLHNLFKLNNHSHEAQRVEQVVAFMMQLGANLNLKEHVLYYLAIFILDSTLDANLSLSLTVFNQIPSSHSSRLRFIADVELRKQQELDQDRKLHLEVLRIICLIKNAAFNDAASGIELLKQLGVLSRFEKRFITEYENISLTVIQPTAYQSLVNLHGLMLQTPVLMRATHDAACVNEA